METFNSSISIRPQYDPRGRRASDLGKQETFFPKENCRRISGVVCRRANNISRTIDNQLLNLSATNQQFSTTITTKLIQLSPSGTENTISTGSTVKILQPKNMSEVKIQQVSNTIREMWSSEHGLQELVKCSHCQSIHSKKDIFGYLDKGIYDLSVSDIMNLLNIVDIKCLNCGNKTDFIYGSNHTRDIKKRLLESVHSFLVVSENNENVVGTGLWYIPKTFNEMYDLEFKDHYKRIGVDKIKEKVNIVLGKEYELMIMFAAIGFLDKYRNLFQLIEFLRVAFSTIPEEYHGLPGIMELDKNNTMHSLFTSIGGISLDFGEENDLITDTRSSYKSDLVVLPDTVKLFNQNFGSHVGKKDILRKLQNHKKSNTTH